MSVNGIGTAGYPGAGYDTRKAERNAAGGSFAKQAAEAAQRMGQAASLHGSDEETGDIAICSNIDIVNNSSITVYKTPDFNSDNPVYKVKIWDKDGNVTERMVDVSKVDPKNCDTVEMYAYTSDLKERGKGSFEDTVLKAAVAKAVKNAEQRDSGSFNLLTKTDWVDIVKNIMQAEYRYGDLNGYMEWKKFLGILGNDMGKNYAEQTDKTAAAKPHTSIVYMKTDDMLYSGGNGTGLSFYIKYAESSTEDDPTVIAKGVDENGDEFEQTIHINKINPKCATIVEMRALEAHMGVKKLDGFTSLPPETGMMGLHDRTDFMDMFQKQISDMKRLSQARTAAYYQYSMQAYWDFMNKK